MPERDGALLAPPQLRQVVMRQLTSAGRHPQPSKAKVVPRRVPGAPNKVLDRRPDRWIARCPECPGAEVVPAAGPWLCGNCGTQAKVDWSLT